MRHIQHFQKRKSHYIHFILFRLDCKKEKKVQCLAAHVLTEPLNDAGRKTISLTLVSITPACDSLMGDVGGEHVSTAKSFLNLNLTFSHYHSIRLLFII